MIASFYKTFLQPPEERIKGHLLVFNAVRKEEVCRSCNTCRNKTEIFHDDYDGNIYRCDFTGFETVNGYAPEIEQCENWERDAGVYDWIKELINEIGGDDIHERESVRSSEGSP